MYIYLFLLYLLIYWVRLDRSFLSCSFGESVLGEHIENVNIGHRRTLLNTPVSEEFKGTRSLSFLRIAGYQIVNPSLFSPFILWWEQAHTSYEVPLSKWNFHLLLLKHSALPCIEGRLHRIYWLLYCSRCLLLPHCGNWTPSSDWAPESIAATEGTTKR